MTAPLGVQLSRITEGLGETTTYATAEVWSWTASGDNELLRNAEQLADVTSVSGEDFVAGDVVALIKYRGTYLVLGRLGARGGSLSLTAGTTAGSPAPFWRRQGGRIQLSGRVSIAASRPGAYVMTTVPVPPADEHRFGLLVPSGITPSWVTAAVGTTGQLYLPFGSPASITEAWLDHVAYPIA